MTEDRFYHLAIVYLFEHKKTDADLLKIILDNYFGSLMPGPVKLETLDDIAIKDGNLEIVIHGFYSAHPSKYVVVLNKRLRIEKLLVY
jgi:hypothetical protein